MPSRHLTIIPKPGRKNSRLFCPLIRTSHKAYSAHSYRLFTRRQPREPGTSQAPTERAFETAFVPRCESFEQPLRSLQWHHSSASHNPVPKCHRPSPPPDNAPAPESGPPPTGVGLSYQSTTASFAIGQLYINHQPPCSRSGSCPVPAQYRASMYACAHEEKGARSLFRHIAKRSRFACPFFPVRRGTPD